MFKLTNLLNARFRVFNHWAQFVIWEFSNILIWITLQCAVHFDQQMMLHLLMFSKWCQNILLFSVLATNFFTKYDDLHSIASLRHPTPIADHYECSNQAFKASNGRNLNKIFQKLKQVFNAFYLNKHEYWAYTWLEIASIDTNLQMQRWNLMFFANSK